MPSTTQMWLSLSMATPLGRAKYPGPSPALPKVLMKLPSPSKISMRLFSVSAT